MKTMKVLVKKHTQIVVAGLALLVSVAQIEMIASNVTIDGCDTGVVDVVVTDDGGSISDLIDECAASAKNHGHFVSCVAHLTQVLKKAGVISGAEKGAIQSCAAQAQIPVPQNDWAVGDWKMDLTAGFNVFPRFVIIETHAYGVIDGLFGVGYDPEGVPTGIITGTIEGQQISMTYERTDVVIDYEAYFEGTIAADGTMSGTWTDNNTFATPQPWSMVRQ